MCSNGCVCGCLCVLWSACAVFCVCCCLRVLLGYSRVILGLVISTNTPSNACLTLAFVRVRACGYAHTGTSHDVRGGEFNVPFSNGVHEWPSRTSQDVIRQGEGSRASQEDTRVAANQERRKRRKGAGGAGTGGAGEGKDERTKSSRFWTKEEHELFLEALDKYHYPSVAAVRKGYEDRPGGAESSCVVSVGLGQGVAEIIASHVRVCGCMCACMSLVCVCVCVCVHQLCLRVVLSRVLTDSFVMHISNACHLSLPSFFPFRGPAHPSPELPSAPFPSRFPLSLSRPSRPPCLRSPAQHSKCDHTRKSTLSACRKSARKHHHMLGARLRRQQCPFPGRFCHS